MLQNATKPLLHSRSLEHTDYLKRLGQWLKQLPVEERYLQVRLGNPAIAAWLRQSYPLAREEDVRSKEEGQASYRSMKALLKVQEEVTQVFFDNLVVTSEFEYMDTIGFDFSLVDDVERFLDLLSGLAFRAKIFTDYSEIPQRIAELPSGCTREQLATNLAHFLLTTIRYRCQQRESGQAALQQERLRKRQYGTLWNSLAPDEKEKLLLLEQSSTIQLLEHLGLKLHVKELDRELRDLQKLEKNEFCNRLLKCKLRRCNQPIRGYYRALFQRLRQKLGLNQHSRKPLRRTARRAKTGSFSSNETNETDIETFDRWAEKAQELSKHKLESDLEEFADLLSERANLHFRHRQVSFKRLEQLLRPFQIDLILFGSCANGLALERSDVDAALSANVLNYFPYGTIKERTVYALEYFANLFSSQWIVSKKSIFTAAIPVLKLEINPSIPLAIAQCSPDTDIASFELDSDCEPNVLVQVDLTIDTRGLVELESSHLGIRSTELIGQSLQETPNLYRVLIFLKYVLLKRGLNSTYKGGISPYCLLIMIKAYLRHVKLVESPCLMLEGFLKFYGQEFDQKQLGIDLKLQASPFYKREPSESRIQVKDPLNNRVMTKNAYQYTKIKEEFLRVKERCIDALKMRVRQSLGSLPEDRLAEALQMGSEQYFQLSSSGFPKNVFCEYDLT